MIVLWILGIVAALIVLKYFYLIVKRVRLVGKIKKRADEVQFLRGRFRSVFLPDGKPDLTVRKGDTVYLVSVLTTPFRRVRYHFNNNERLELILERRGMFVLNPRAPGNNASIDRVFRIKKYKITFCDHPEKTFYVIPYPAPRLSLTRAYGAQMTALGNGDILFGKIKICGLNYFLEEVLSAE